MPFLYISLILCPDIRSNRIYFLQQLPSFLWIKAIQQSLIQGAFFFNPTRERKLQTQISCQARKPPQSPEAPQAKLSPSGSGKHSTRFHAPSQSRVMQSAACKLTVPRQLREGSDCVLVRRTGKGRQWESEEQLGDLQHPRLKLWPLLQPRVWIILPRQWQVLSRPMPLGLASQATQMHRLLSLMWTQGAAEPWASSSCTGRHSRPQRRWPAVPVFLPLSPFSPAEIQGWGEEGYLGERKVTCNQPHSHLGGWQLSYQRKKGLQGCSLEGTLSF